MNKINRKDYELPAATAEWGWRFHHLGIPTTELIPDEEYFEKFKLAHGGFPTSPFGVEWMRFEEGSPVHELIKKVPHLAFEVDNLELEMAKHPFTVITPINSPAPGTRVIMIEYNGAPIELIEFTKSRAESESGG